MLKTRRCVSYILAFTSCGVSSHLTGRIAYTHSPWQLKDLATDLGFERGNIPVLKLVLFSEQQTMKNEKDFPSESESL